MFRIHAVRVPAITNARENWLSFIHWLCKCFGIKFALPRKALRIPVFDNKRFAHLTIGTANARLGLVSLDAPDMPATVTYRFVLFHPIILVVLD